MYNVIWNILVGNLEDRVATTLNLSSLEALTTKLSEPQTKTCSYLLWAALKNCILSQTVRVIDFAQ